MARVFWRKNKPMPSIRRKEVEPLPIFRKLYRPLGAVAFSFADLEAQLTLSLNVLLGIAHREGMALEWLMQNVSLRVELFYFLAMRITQNPTLKPNAPVREIRISEAVSGLRKSAEIIYGAMQQANSDRNNLLHGAWTGITPTSPPSYAKYRYKAAEGKLTEIPLRGISLKLLEEEVEFITSVTWRLRDWTARIKRWESPNLWPAPLPDKSLLHSPLARLLRENKSQARQRQPAPSRM